ncbi:MAG: hypothetical protein Q9172_001249 [Xanthocarpia lactea]
MHETFYAPKGCWETLYEEFPPWGLAKAVRDEENRFESEETFISDPKNSTMFRRMGRPKFSKEMKVEPLA